MYVPNELIEIIKKYVFYVCSTCKIEKIDIEEAIFINETESGYIYLCRNCFNTSCIII